jgi:hypothetical protein
VKFLANEIGLRGLGERDVLLSTFFVRIMDAMLEAGLIIIGRPSSEHITIRITRSADDWAIGTVNISVGPWSGSVPAWFSRGELRQFANEIDRLYRDLKGR